MGVVACPEKTFSAPRRASTLQVSTLQASTLQAAAAKPARGFFARIMDGIIAARTEQAERAFARYQRLSGDAGAGDGRRA